MNERETNGITPKLLTDKIIEICNNNDINNLFYVSRQLKDDCEAGNCFTNIQKYKELFGGNLLMGWAISVRKNLYIECEAHAVWQTPDDQILDLTPPSHEDGVLTLFSHQKDMPVVKTPSKYIPITQSELVQEYITLRNQFEQIRCTSTGETLQIPKSLMDKIIEIDDIFLLKVGVNEKCPCGSSLKYKKCCGR